MAMAMILCVFALVRALPVGEQSAQASSIGLPGKSIERDAQNSVAQKRGFRRAVLNNHENMMTLTGGQVRSILNQPELVRRDLPTVVWQYRNDECVLDVYFTSSNTRLDNTPVAHYEVRGREDADEYAADVCLGSLIRANAGNGLNFASIEVLYKAD